MASRILALNSKFHLKPGSIAGRVFTVAVRLNHKGPQAAPPMNCISPGEHVVRYLFYVVVILSYPTYVLYNVGKGTWLPRPDTGFSEEAQAIMDERVERRSRGEQPVVDPEWIKFINERDREKRAREEAEQASSR